MDKRKKQELRKKRRRQKQIRSFTLLILFLLILIFAVKGLIGLIKGDGVDDSSSKPNSQSIESISNSNSSSSVNNSNNVTSDINSDKNTSSSANKPAPNEFCTLVNPKNKLDGDFEVETRKISGTEKLFDVRAADSLEAMLNDARDAGYPMFLVSTYRTVKYQQGLFDRKINEYVNMGYTKEAAEEEAAKWVAVPGTSEHNLGLAADIVSSTWYNTNNDLTWDFEKTDHFKWLYEHCAEYGFILRYPKSKESVTEIVYEPWHYRYVGKEVAKYIMENNLTLEEFLEE